MPSWDDVREFFGLKRKRLHPLWLELFRTVDQTGSVDDPERLLISLIHGYVLKEGDRYVLTEKGRRAAYSSAKP